MAMTQPIPRTRAAETIRALGACIITFRKKDLNMRTIQCLPFTANCDLSYEYVLVYDTEAKGIRQVNLKTIHTIQPTGGAFPVVYVVKD